MNTVTSVVDPKTLFDRWFDRAISQLEKLENGDGGTAGMMIGEIRGHFPYLFVISLGAQGQVLKSKFLAAKVISQNLTLLTPNHRSAPAHVR